MLLSDILQSLCDNEGGKRDCGDDEISEGNREKRLAKCEAH